MNEIKVLTWNLFWKGLVSEQQECKMNDLREQEIVKFFQDPMNESILREIQSTDAKILAINKQTLNPGLLREMKKIANDINKQTSLYNKPLSKCKENILDKLNELHNRHNLDFICLQEASNIYFEDTPLFRRPFISDFTPIYHKLKFNTIITLVNTKKYEFYIDAKTGEKKNIILWGFNTSRPFIIAKVKNKITKKNVIIINVHLPHLEEKLGDTKDMGLINNLKYLVSLLRESWEFKDYKDDQIIISGDFNDEIDRPIVLFDLTLYNEGSSNNGDQVKIVKEYGKNVRKVELIPTCCYNFNGEDDGKWTPKNYDHILINDKLKYNFIHYPIKIAENILFSDHLPILATLEVKNIAPAPVVNNPVNYDEVFGELEPKSRGGYYEKYMKYKEKYLKLKSFLI